MELLERKIQLYEIGPRDFRLVHRLFIPARSIAYTISKLAVAGINKFEIGASINYEKKDFSHMANTYEILGILRTRKIPGRFCIYCGPGKRNYPKLKIQELLESRFLQENPGMPDEISVSISASEDRNQEIYHMSGDRVMDNIKRLIELAREDNIPVRGYVSAAFGYRTEDDVSFDNSIQRCNQLLNLGCYQIALGDTRGKANLGVFLGKLSHIKTNIPLDKLALHFHEDEYMTWQTDAAFAIANGIYTFDTCIMDIKEPHKTTIKKLVSVDRDIPPNVSTEKMIEFLSQMDSTAKKDRKQFNCDAVISGVDPQLVEHARKYITREIESARALSTSRFAVPEKRGYRDPF